MSGKIFCPLDIQPVRDTPEVIVIDDDDDEVEEISDDSDDEANKNERLERAKKELEDLIKNDPHFLEEMLAPWPPVSPSPPRLPPRPSVIVVKPPPRPNVIVVNGNVQQKTQVIVEKTLICPPRPSTSEQESRRRKERQRIKRKKANKRRYQKKIWRDRLKNAPFYI